MTCVCLVCAGVCPVCAVCVLYMLCLSCMHGVCQRETTLDQMAGTVPLATLTLLNDGTQWEQR